MFWIIQSRFYKCNLINNLFSQLATTRDTLEEHIYLHGISLHIVDTAGIRDTDDRVEQIGVLKAKDAARDADLIIYTVFEISPFS